jgi:hypothetical protein
MQESQNAPGYCQTTEEHGPAIAYRNRSLRSGKISAEMN